MPSRTELLTAIDELLDCGSFPDYCPNGLQVAGGSGDHEVRRVATGVSASLELFEQAAEWGAQVLLVHHGLIWGEGLGVIDDRVARRLRVLLDAGITLAGYHLPLDAHPTLGNNALLRDGLGLEPVDTAFAEARGRAIGVVGSYGEPRTLAEVGTRLGELVGQAPVHVGAQPASVSRVAICSGGGARFVDEAAGLGAQVLVTGEADEPTMATAREAGIAVLAAGHYASETVGIRALGEHVAAQFGVEHRFFAIPNPV